MRTASTTRSTEDSSSKQEFLLGLLEDWIIEDEIDGSGSSESCDEWIDESKIQNHDRQQIVASSLPDVDNECGVSETEVPSPSLSPLEALAPDLSANVLQYLTVQEIVLVVATLSKKMHVATQRSDLWKLKFESRWNLGWSEHGKSTEHEPQSSQFYISNWYSAYRQAYENVHDLWITHWNIVYPHDGLSPGRCCIASQQEKDVVLSVDSASNNVLKQLGRLCPNCRNRYYHQHQDDINAYMSSASSEAAIPVKTLAQAITAATMVRLHQSPLTTSPYDPNFARRAFANASTLNRTLSTNQYKAHSLAFLTDLLFFQTHQDRSELEDLKYSFKRQKQLDENTIVRDHADDAGEQQPRPQLRGGDSRNHHSHHSDVCETAAHSWHTVHFTNPDYIRPLVWRVSIQRPDCFTVFPSEGTLQPGESALVVFGVRPLASLLAHSMHQLNAHREGVAEFWASVYTEEAHLPAAPFLIHYHFTSAIPCQPAGRRGSVKFPSHSSTASNDDGNAIHNRLSQPNTGGFERSLVTSHSFSSASPWEQQQKADGRLEPRRQPLRTIYLSAHVNGNYPLYEFWRSTLVPFFDVPEERHQQRAMTVYCAPYLMERDPHIHSQLENLKLERQVNSSESNHPYFLTEAPCLSCQRRWGARTEELMQAHVLAQLECGIVKQRRDRLLQRIAHTLRHLVRLHVKSCRIGLTEGPGIAGHCEDDESIEEHQLAGQQRKLHTIMTRLVDFRGSPWMSQRQRQLLIRWEVVVDELYCLSSAISSSAASEGDSISGISRTPWRHAGVYPIELCTDSVFGKDEMSLSQFTVDDLLDRMDGSNASLYNLWKEEPAYLEGFAHLAHSPGRLCLGPQEDPNHLKQKLHLRKNRFNRQQNGFVSDMFMDDPICTLQSALCVLCDPSSLLVHGIYDRIPYPGTLVRRPKLYLLSRLDPESCAGVFAMDRPRFLHSAKRETYFQLQDALDMEAVALVDSWCLRGDDFHLPHGSNAISGLTTYRISLNNYLMNIPAPGMGRFSLCTKQEDGSSGGAGITSRENTASNDCQIVELLFETSSNEAIRPNEVDERSVAGEADGTFGEQDNVPIGVRNNNVFHENLLAPMRGPRALNLLWMMSAHFGWTVNDYDGSSVFVDRRILIGSQWFSISLMTAPLFWTLFARYAQWIPAQPVDYTLEALPFDVDNEMRFLTERECGYVAILLVIAWLLLGRWVERYTSRDFLRAMLEHMSNEERGQSILALFGSRVSRWLHRRWDAVCPLFLQRLVFTPHWNRRTQSDLLKHVAFWRSRDRREHRSIFRAIGGQGLMLPDSCDGQIDFGEESSTRKLLVGIIVALGSFSASSPHFFLNLLTVFSCSISLGLSMSLQSMETGRQGVTTRSTGSILKALSLVTIVILAFLVGQLVGSSGGILFLAEFVVTSISLILGGAGTISASAMESWATFFCLSMTAFWGYLVGRVAILEGIRQKRRGLSSTLLCASLVVLLIIWLFTFFVWKWEAPVQIVILRSMSSSVTNNTNRRNLAKELQ